MTTLPAEAIVHIIDDDAAVRDALGILLRVRGVMTQTYASAQGFLDAPDLGARGCILSDVQMPEMSGLELLRRLHARGESLPLVMMSGRVERGMTAEAAGYGATFVEKPFAPDEIAQAVLAAIRRCDERP